MRKLNVGNDSSKPESPVSKYLLWANLTKVVKDSDGDEEVKVIGGKFYYDTQEKDENGDIVYSKTDVPLPISFTLLDSKCFSFKGYHEPSKTGFYSNEVDDFDSIISVKTKEGVFVEFTMREYVSKEGANLREKLAGKSIKSVKSIYGVAKNEEGELEMINLQLKGTQDYVAADKKAGFSAFLKTNSRFLDKYDIVVENVVITQKDKQSRKYAYPVWSLSKKLTDETNEDALNEFYDILTAYHIKYKEYINSAKKENLKTKVSEEEDEDEDELNYD